MFHKRSEIHVILDKLRNNIIIPKVRATAMQKSV